MAMPATGQPAWCLRHPLLQAPGLLAAGVVVAFQANQLPNPLVEVSMPGQPTYQVAAKHSLKPHFPTEHPARFERVTQEAALTVRLYDDKAGRRNQLLGEAVLPCKEIKVWLALQARANMPVMHFFYLGTMSLAHLWSVHGLFLGNAAWGTPVLMLAQPARLSHAVDSRRLWPSSWTCAGRRSCLCVAPTPGTAPDGPAADHQGAPGAAARAGERQPGAGAAAAPAPAVGAPGGARPDHAPGLLAGGLRHQRRRVSPASGPHTTCLLQVWAMQSESLDPYQM